MTDVPETTQQDSKPQPKRRRLRFWLLIILAILVLLPILLIGILLLVLRSETGTAWVIDQIPGLEASQAQGSLLGQWQAETLVWQGDGVDVRIRAPLIDWSPTCLAGKELCLDRLTAEAIDVTLPPPEESDEPAQDISLPEVDLPLALTVGTVDLGPFTLNESLVWDRLELSANGSGSDWTLSKLSTRRDDLTVDISGRLQTRGDWPLDLAVKLDLPPPEGDQWLLDLNLTGSAQDLLIRGQSEGYLNATLNGQVEPLKSQLPVQLRLQTERFLALGTLPKTLTLLNADVSLEGSLADGFEAELTSDLPANNDNVALALSGLITTTGVQGLNIQLSGKGTGDSETGTATVTGDASWEGDLAAGANVSVEAFPWFSFIPDFEPPPVTLERLNADISYQGGRYDATLEADVDGPQGKANLTSSVSGDDKAVEVTDLTVNTGAGSLNGRANVGFAGPVEWQAAVDLSEFNPGYWVPTLEASLNGEVTTEGRLNEDGLPVVQAAWDLEGTWRDSEAIIRGAVDRPDETLKLTDLDFRVGENQVTGQGMWGPELSGDFNLTLPKPELLLPELRGSMSGEVSVSGTVDQPQGSVTLNGKGLAWQDQAEIQQLDVSASLSSGNSLDAKISATNIKGSGQAIEKLSLALSGAQQDHRLDLTATHQEAEVAVSLAGAFSSAWNAWNGQLTQGKVDVLSQNQSWILAEPADLAYTETGELTFGEHCWAWAEASLCGGDQTLLPEQVISYQIRNFPTTALSPLLPDTLRWDTVLNADISVQNNASGPVGEVTVDVGSGEFAVRNGEEWESFQYDTFTSRVELVPDQANLSVNLSGSKLGNLSASVAVDPQSEDKTIDGRFEIAGLDIAMATVFAGLEEIQGKLNGEGSLSGPLVRPAVTGEIALTGGKIADPTLPMPLEDMMLRLALKGYSADISGQWKSSPQGSGELGGTVSWESEPALDLKLTGTRLPINVDPYAQIELEPDLTIAFQGGDLMISGQLAVPRGAIQITTLPEQAVAVSEDEVIIGAEPEESALGGLNMDVTVVVGEDQVSFNGFGLTGDLEGTLRIGNEMDTRGSLNLIGGLFQKYGQDLTLRRARLLFTGPIGQPYLDIEAIRQVDNVIAGLRLSGPVTSPQTEVFSEPSMPQTDALSYLILGKAPGTPSEDGQMRNAAISLGLNQASKVTRGLGEKVGIRDLAFEAEGSGDEASVVASGYLTDELSLRYGVGIFEPITTVALRYDLGRYFYLEAASGLAASLDIFYNRNF